MNKIWIIIGAITVAALLAQADRALPVDADSMSRADALLGASANKGKTASTFGKAVSEEAKALKDSDEATRKAFGDSIASQRRQGSSPNTHTPDSNLGNSFVTGVGSDPRSHVPPQGSGSNGHGKGPGKK